MGHKGKQEEAKQKHLPPASRGGGETKGNKAEPEK